MISLVIPVHNEERILQKNLGKLLDYLKSLGGEFEIVLVENGSTDNTLKIADEISGRDKRVRVFSINQKDLGRALREGILNAQGEYLVWYPIDLSVDFAYIPESLEYIRDYDIIVGSKEHRESSVTRSGTRKFLSLVYNSFVNLLFNLGISDTQCVKTFRAESTKTVVEKAGSGGIIWEVELLYLAKKAGLRVMEIPVNVRDLRKGSKIRILDMIKAFINLIILRINLSMP
jgi:glycosyltransferase involved in cell wall biosynthesis